MTSNPGGILRLEISERLSPVFDGTSFENTGPYESLSGTIFGELDPAHPGNATIVNLGKAPRNAAGRVEYRSAFTLLKPIDMTRANGWLMYDVVNRGNKLALTRLNKGADGNRPATAAHAGDGFLMRHGFSVVWSAWQTGVPADGDRLEAILPIATNPDGPVTAICREEFIAEGFGPGDAFCATWRISATTGTLAATPCSTRCSRSFPDRAAPISIAPSPNPAVIRVSTRTIRSSTINFPFLTQR